jgi:hypothetical protein
MLSVTASAMRTFEKTNRPNRLLRRILFDMARETAALVPTHEPHGTPVALRRDKPVGHVGVRHVGGSEGVHGSALE